MANNLEAIKRHLAKPIPITFKNAEGEEDTFTFKPFNIEQQALFMEISKRMESRKKVTVKNAEGQDVSVPEVTKEDIIEVSKLFEDIVKNSIPEMDDETAKEFVNSNFEVLFQKIELLIPKTQNSSALELIKQRKEAAGSG
jgi:predicted dienelactone hydrolase